MQRIMMYLDVLSSKMHEERSNKVLNSSDGPFSLTFVCPGLGYRNLSVPVHQCLSCFVQCFDILWSYKETPRFSKWASRSRRINLPPGIFSQRNDMFERLRAQCKYKANQQAAGQPDLQISGRTVQVSQAVQPRHRFNKQRDLFFWIPHVQNRGGGVVHHAKWYHTRGVRTGYLENRLLV